MLNREDEIRAAIKELVAEKGYQFVLFFATDILAEGSQFIVEGDTDFVNRAFGIDVTGKSVWMPGVLSRKKQVAAPIWLSKRPSCARVGFPAMHVARERLRAYC